MATKNIITHARLREVRLYDPDDGWFYQFKKIPQRWERTGSPHNKGYIRVGVDYCEYLAHVLAWFYMTGVWPRGEVHHKNDVKTDNRWVNLEDLTPPQHSFTKHMMRTNTTGFSGVYYGRSCNGWRAQYDNKHLGVFPTKEEAYAAYLKARSIAQRRHMGLESSED